MAWDMASTLLAPVHADPAAQNPLHAILRDTVDFDAVRRCRDLKLFIAATHVRSGRQRIWRRDEIGIEAVLASACLPTLFPAVEVDGEAYWDGGYMGNPSLLPLLTETPTLDLMLVQVHPSARAELPLGSAAVLDRINEITFHGSLVKELRSLAILRKLIQDEGLLGRAFHEPLFRKAAALRVHRIEGGEKLDALASAGMLDSAWHRLLALHRAGHAAADTWLTDHFTHLGRHGTVDLVAEYLDGEILNGRMSRRAGAATPAHGRGGRPYTPSAASALIAGSPSACATGSQVMRPRWTFRPRRRCGSSTSARSPRAASASPNGRVAWLSAWLEVCGTAPGMLATQ